MAYEPQTQAPCYCSNTVSIAPAGSCDVAWGISPGGLSQIVTQSPKREKSRNRTRQLSPWNPNIYSWVRYGQQCDKTQPGHRFRYFRWMAPMEMLHVAWRSFPRVWVGHEMCFFEGHGVKLRHAQSIRLPCPGYFILLFETSDRPKQNNHIVNI